MGGRLIQLLLALSLLLNAFFLAGFVYRSWLLPQVERQLSPPATASGRTWVGPLEAMAGDLGLNDKQRQALKDVFEKNHADRRKRFQEIQQLREQAGGELRKSPVDWTKVDTLIEQTARLRGEAQKENLRAILDLEPQLTPAQRDKLHSVLADRFINPPRWSGQGRGTGPGQGPGRPTQ